MKNLWKRWKRFGKKVGDFQARLILSLFYYLIPGLFALIVRLATDPLGVEQGTRHGWTQKSEPEGTIRERATKQF